MIFVFVKLVFEDYAQQLSRCSWGSIIGSDVGSGIAIQTLRYPHPAISIAILVIAKQRVHFVQHSTPVPLSGEGYAHPGGSAVNFPHR